MDTGPDANATDVESADQVQANGQFLCCDRCGAAMIEMNCKLVCLNCGNRLDCSDLNIYFD